MIKICMGKPNNAACEMNNARIKKERSNSKGIYVHWKCPLDFIQWCMFQLNIWVAYLSGGNYYNRKALSYG